MNLWESTLLLTRPAEAAARFAAALERDLGRFGRVVTAPLMQIVPLPLPEALGPGTGVILTSEAALPAAQALTDGRGARGPAWCVGARTAEAALAAGFSPVLAAPEAEALLETLLADPPDLALVHLSGRHQRGDLAARLTARGIPTRRIAVYDQQALPPDPVLDTLGRGRGWVVAPVFSPRSAALLAAALPGRPVAGLRPVALSLAVARAWELAAKERRCDHPPVAAIARSADAAGMVAAIAGLYGRGGGA